MCGFQERIDKKRCLYSYMQLYRCRLPHLLSHHELVQKLGSVPRHKLSRQFHNTTAVEQPKRNLETYATDMQFSFKPRPPFKASILVWIRDYHVTPLSDFPAFYRPVCKKINHMKWISSLVSCYCVLHIQCLAIDLGHLNQLAKFLFAMFRLYSDNLLQATER